MLTAEMLKDLCDIADILCTMNRHTDDTAMSIIQSSILMYEVSGIIDVTRLPGEKWQ